MVREIVKFGSRVLRQKCAPVAQVDGEIEQLVEDLFDSMREAPQDTERHNPSLVLSSLLAR